MERVPEIRNVLLEREHVQNKAESKFCRYVVCGFLRAVS